MPCRKPELADRLIAYQENLLQGGELGAMEEHLAGCEDCRRELKELGQMSGLLNQAAIQVHAAQVSSCPDADELELLARVPESMNPAARDTALAHVMSCGACSETLQVLKRFQVEYGDQLEAYRDGSRNLPGKLKAALREEYRSPTAPPWWKELFRLPATPVMAWAAAAAVILLFIGLGIIMGTQRLDRGRPVAVQGADQIMGTPLEEQVAMAPTTAESSPGSPLTGSLLEQANKPDRKAGERTQEDIKAGKGAGGGELSSEGRDEKTQAGLASPGGGSGPSAVSLERGDESRAENYGRVGTSGAADRSPDAAQADTESPAKMTQTLAGPEQRSAGAGSPRPTVSTTAARQAPASASVSQVPSAPAAPPPAGVRGGVGPQTGGQLAASRDESMEADLSRRAQTIIDRTMGERQATVRIQVEVESSGREAADSSAGRVRNIQVVVVSRSVLEGERKEGVKQGLVRGLELDPARGDGVTFERAP